MMKKIMFVSLLIVSLFVLGCVINVNETQPAQTEVNPSEPSAAQPVEPACEEKIIDYEISNLEKTITPYPSPVNIKSYVGRVKFAFVNKDKTKHGDVNISIECETPTGTLYESQVKFAPAGGRVDFDLMCQSKDTRGILSVSDPKVESAPIAKSCS